MSTADFELDLDELFPQRPPVVDDLLVSLGLTGKLPQDPQPVALASTDVSPMSALTDATQDSRTIGQDVAAVPAPQPDRGVPVSQSDRADRDIDDFVNELSDEDLRSTAMSPGRILEDALCEYELAGRPGTYVRSVGLGRARFLIVGTWRGVHNGQGATIFGCAGREATFVKSEYLIADTTNDARSHRVWMLQHMTGLPVRMWFNTGGADRVTRYIILDASDVGIRDVDKVQYEQARKAWNAY